MKFLYCHMTRDLKFQRLMSPSVCLTTSLPLSNATKRAQSSLFLITGSTVLGAGAFGLVIKGTYNENSVAIKMLKSNSTSNAEYLRSLLGELKVMSYLGNHHNLVALIGAITENIKSGEVYLIFEYCSKGNALQFVRNHTDDFVDMWACPPPTSSVFSKRRGMRYVMDFAAILRQCDHVCYDSSRLLC